MGEAWLVLVLFAGVCGLMVLIARLLPVGTPLWHVGALSFFVVVLAIFGPAVLVQLLAAVVELATGPLGAR